MREKKFRAWDKENKRWYKNNPKAYKEYLCISDDVMVVVEYKPNNSGGYSPCAMRQLNNPEVDKIILMQYTGLKDKNGKEIYEGDIIESIENGMIYKIENFIPITRMCEYDCSIPIGKRDGKEILRGNGISESYSDDWMSNPKFYEIIGNIYENEELIK
ncbi:MAG: YopX family protein [Candidatus Helarchaeota archaeon]